MRCEVPNASRGSQVARPIVNHAAASISADVVLDAMDAVGCASALLILPPLAEKISQKLYKLIVVFGETKNLCLATN